MNVKLLTEHHLEFLTSKGGCTGLSESTLVKMSYCWKSQVVALMSLFLDQCTDRISITIQRHIPIRESPLLCCL